MRVQITIPFIVLIVSILSNPSFAEKRLALVIGNEQYAPQVGILKNPHNDIDLVGKALTQVGFSVVAKLNLGRSDIMRQVSEFAQRLSDAGSGTIGFFYYSGHGVSRPLDHVNYLIPVDVVNLQDQNFWWNAVSLDAILSELEKVAPDASHIIVFDACRNELRIPTKGSKGFEPVVDRNGMFIAFATSPNTSSSDIGENGGPYARTLASELTRPGQDQLTLFQNVKERVFSATGNAQRPWENNGLLERIYLAGKPPLQKEPGLVDEAKRIWEAFGRRSVDTKFLENFVVLYGETEYGPLARKRIADIAQQAPTVNAPRSSGSTSPIRSNIVRAIIPNSESYSSGETIRIKVIASSSRVKAFAVFPFGPKERSKVEAGYNVAEGGLYIPYKVPNGVTPGVYSVAVYVQEMESKLEEHHDIEIVLK